MITGVLLTSVTRGTKNGYMLRHLTHAEHGCLDTFRLRMHSCLVINYRCHGDCISFPSSQFCFFRSLGCAFWRCCRMWEAIQRRLPVYMHSLIRTLRSLLYRNNEVSIVLSISTAFFCLALFDAAAAIGCPQSNRERNKKKFPSFV